MVGWKENGKKNVKYFSGKTKEEVIRKSLECRRTYLGRSVYNKDYLFEEWSHIWFELHKDNITPTTQEGYKYTLRKLNEYFGKKKLTEIKAYDIDVFLKHLRAAGMATSTLAQYKGIMYMIMHKAEASDLIAKNPTRFTEKIRFHKKKAPKEAFSFEEVQILMRELPYDRIGISIRLLLATGMRTQELLALEPRHIAEDGSQIIVEQAVQLVKGTVFVGPVKTDCSARKIPLPTALWDCAKNLRTSTDKKFIWEEKKLNTPANPTFFRDEFKKAIEAIPGVRALTPHSCRHTYVSHLQALGVDVPTIQSLVGHADMEMTEYYLHVQECVRKDAVERFGNAFMS